MPHQAPRPVSRPARSPRTRILLTIAVALLLATAIAPVAGAAEPDAAARERAAGRAVERGLAWLAAEWEKGGIDKPENAADVYGRGHVAVASLAGLAFLQDGAEPGKGRYGAALRQCIDFVAARADAETGLIAPQGNVAPMYVHGYATFLLAEAYARTNDAALKPKVAAAVRLIEQAQNAEGGWRYLPKPLDGDVSVTCCQLVALRAAQKAGIDVDQKTIDRGVRFVRSCQSADGGFVYIPGGGASGFARSAAALAVMTHCGVRGAPYDKTIAYLERVIAAGAKPPAAAAAPGDGFFLYANYYIAHSVPAAAADARAKLYTPLRDRLVARQTERGSWDGDVSPEYATASAVFALQAPDSRLNLFKPDKPAAPVPAKRNRGNGEPGRDETPGDK